MTISGIPKIALNTAAIIEKIKPIIKITANVGNATAPIINVVRVMIIIIDSKIVKSIIYFASLGLFK